MPQKLTKGNQNMETTNSLRMNGNCLSLCRRFLQYVPLLHLLSRTPFFSTLMIWSLGSCRCMGGIFSWILSYCMVHPSIVWRLHGRVARLSKWSWDGCTVASYQSRDRKLREVLQQDRQLTCMYCLNVWVIHHISGFIFNASHIHKSQPLCQRQVFQGCMG